MSLVVEVLPCCGCFITCMSAYFPTVELDNAIRFSTLSRNSGFLWHSSKWTRWFGCFLQYLSGLEVLACSLDTDFKACVCYFSLFLKDKCISSFVWTKSIENKFTQQLFFLPTVSRTFILSWATMHYPPPWNFLFRKNNCMCNWDNARDIATCLDE